MDIGTSVEIAAMIVIALVIGCWLLKPEKTNRR